MISNATALTAEPGVAPRRITQSKLLHRPVTAADGTILGRVADVIVRLGGQDYPPVTGLLVAVGRRRDHRDHRMLLPLECGASLDGPSVTTGSSTADLHPFERRPNELLLHTDVLGRDLIDVHSIHFVHARDVELESRDGGWVLRGVDVHAPSRLARTVRRRRAHRVMLDWSVFGPLLGRVVLGDPAAG